MMFGLERRLAAEGKTVVVGEDTVRPGAALRCCLEERDLSLVGFPGEPSLEPDSEDLDEAPVRRRIHLRLLDCRCCSTGAEVRNMRDGGGREERGCWDRY